MERIIGIDLGTTNSVVAFVDPFSGKGTCIQNQEGSNLTASVVCFENREKTMIGNTAKHCNIIYPDTTVTHVKRLMGIEKTAITIDGNDYSPQQISALLLKRLKDDAEAELDEKVNKAVITVPAYYNCNQIQAVREAAELSGLELLEIIHEPIAILYHADAIKNYAGKTVIIFDLGGGTLDIVCARVTDNTIDEICIMGDGHCGGSDWDQALVEYIKKTYLVGCDLDAASEQELIAKAEEAKKELTKKNDVSFSIMTEHERKEIKISREEFEQCTIHWLNRAMNVLEEMKVSMCEKGINCIDQIILSGGATRMPQIERGVAEVFPGVELLGKDRDQAVAKGAAIFAEAFIKEKQPEIKRTLDTTVRVKKLNRVSSHSYGISAYIDENEKKVCNILRQNSQLPMVKEEVFYTRYDNQKQVSLEVFESVANRQYEEIKCASMIGKCYLDINGDIPKHSPILVKMSLEENGLLSIWGYEYSGNTEIKSEFKTHALLSKDELVIEKSQVEDIYEKVV